MNRTRAQPSALLFDLHRLTVFRGDRRVLHDISLQVRLGEHLALLGPNGCGKSTLIKALVRELFPVPRRRGFRFNVLGHEQWDSAALARVLGVVEMDLLEHLSREITLRSVTVRELVLSGFFGGIGLWPHMRVTARHERETRRILRFLEIGHLARRPATELSSGEQRRALIGRALVHRPAALILDEPTNSLDPGAVGDFRGLLGRLARAGTTLILVTHHIADLVPEIERVVLMRKGRIVADGPKSLLLTSARLSQLFGTRLRVRRSGDRYDLGPTVRRRARPAKK